MHFLVLLLQAWKKPKKPGSSCGEVSLGLRVPRRAAAGLETLRSGTWVPLCLGENTAIRITTTIIRLSLLTIVIIVLIFVKAVNKGNYEVDAECIPVSQLLRCMGPTAHAALPSRPQSLSSLTAALDT